MYIFFCLIFILFSFLSFFLSVVFFEFNSIFIEFHISYCFSNLSFIFMIDFISLLFFSCVCFISSIVFFYSGFYMNILLKESSDSKRFLAILFLFVVSMFFLIFSYSWTLLMLGWDGLGIVSFLLVIYYNDEKSFNSGILTVFTNRIGDCFFILSFMFMFYFMDYTYLFISYESCFVFSFLLMLGCITKSAQIPFSSWLPAAMAAPTPVSSLVHSSTLVTAGVFLIIRFNYLFSNVWFILSYVSLLTMILGGLFANLEVDFKKIVAMSTLSQLGLMIFSVSMGYWLLCFLHMLFHALFKSLLFLSTGGLMHLLMGNQDSRFFGSLTNIFYSKLFFSISCFSLMGFPFFLGFYSKDLMVGIFLLKNFELFSLFFCLFCIFTVSYSIRLIFIGFMMFPSFYSFISFSEKNNFFFPLLFLFLILLSCSSFYFYSYFPLVLLNFFESFLGVLIIIMGILNFYFLKMFKYNFYFLFSKMFFFTEFSILFGKGIFLSSYNYKFDLSWMEMFGSHGVKTLIYYYDMLLKKFFNLELFIFLKIVLLFVFLFIL
uniref:NADH:ubiquinone reductase (H(+)-translocating) n=1 Tax=Ardeacarus ardeae TaxID=1932962 RepID=A0A343BSI1_9ACAR|nr:NADH dehydrogenase subunit 5 [Ardeacarus ardeae]